MKSISFFKETTVSTSVQDVIDVDVTPVMNMFVILIPFLVSMAVFTHLSVLEFSLPPNVGAGLDSSGGKAKPKLTVVVQNKFLAVTKAGDMLDSIPAVNGKHDLKKLSEILTGFKTRIDGKGEVIVAVGDSVLCGTMVNVMDICRSSGFADVGLSNAVQ